MSSKYTILLVGTFLSHEGGFRSVTEELAIRLRGHGWQVITTSQKLARFPRLFDIITTVWKCRNLYQAAQIDIYSGAAFIWAEIAGLMLNAFKTPFILTLHGGNLPKFAERWSGRVHRLLRSAYVVTTPSRYLLEAMQPYRGDIRLIPNTLDLSIYEYRLRENPRPNLIWLRAFHAIYNHSLAPRVLAQLISDYPDARLTMVGPDKGDGSLQETQRIAKNLGVLDRIHFPGGVPKISVPEWLNKADIFINTTNVDNTPVSVIEAMACGLCVVSTNVGGIPYLLEHEHDALLVPSDNPKAMAEAIQRLLIEPALAEKLSANARSKAERYDWSEILPQWEDLLTDI